jgi:hypothetical protein
MYPVTPTLSVAVKEVIDTVREDDVEGMVKVETVGAVTSAEDVNVAVTEVLEETVTLHVLPFDEEQPDHEVV